MPARGLRDAQLAADVDGAVTTDVERQLARLPADATHLVLQLLATSGRAAD